jgi:hypothetical protein
MENETPKKGKYFILTIFCFFFNIYSIVNNKNNKNKEKPKVKSFDCLFDDEELPDLGEFLTPTMSQLTTNDTAVADSKKTKANIKRSVRLNKKTEIQPTTSNSIVTKKIKRNTSIEFTLTSTINKKIKKEPAKVLGK